MEPNGYELLCREIYVNVDFLFEDKNPRAVANILEGKLEIFCFS